VYVGGVQAGAGLNVTASIASWNTSQGVITDSSGAYWLGIAPPEGINGTIHFYVNGVEASETDTFNPGTSARPFDLHVTYIPIPTPTLTATTNATPTATPMPTCQIGTPQILYPLNGATDVPVNITLDWSDCVNASSYDIYLDNFFDPRYYSSTSNSSYQLPQLPYNTTFYWKIAAINYSCSDPHALDGIWSFTSFTTCSEPTPTPTPTTTPTPTASHGNGTVAPSGGTVNTTDGNIRIEFPSGAFNASTNVSIQGSACHENTSGFMIGSTCFNVTPDGNLGGTARICVNLSVDDFSMIYNKSNVILTLGYWANYSWNVASKVTITGTTICGETSHLSDWAVLCAAVNGTPTPTPIPSVSPTPITTAQPTSTPTPTNTPSQTDKSSTNWALIGGIAGGVILLMAIIIAITIKSRSGKSAKRNRKSKRRSANKAEEIHK
jgi:hypothetical protein